MLALPVTVNSKLHAHDCAIWQALASSTQSTQQNLSEHLDKIKHVAVLRDLLMTNNMQYMYVRCVLNQHITNQDPTHD